jgi:CheY-like chemotaxis protein
LQHAVVEILFAVKVQVVSYDSMAHSAQSGSLVSLLGTRCAVLFTRLPESGDEIQDFLRDAQEIFSPFARFHNLIYISRDVHRVISDAGARHISPPVTLSKVYEVLTSITGVLPVSSTPLRPPSPQPLRNACILVADDVVINQKVICFKLEQRGYFHVKVVNNGQEAVDEVSQSSTLYDLIFMDVMMPFLDDYEATRRIRQYPRYASIPIIGITGNCAPDEIQQCMDAGITTAMGKPIDSRRLYALLEKYTVGTSKNRDIHIHYC